MTSTHPETTVYAGSRWQFNINIFNANGSQMDVTNKSVEWRLLDRTQHAVLLEPGDVLVDKYDAVHGRVAVSVSTSKSLAVGVGRYTDYLRVGGEDIVLQGQISVAASPFGLLLDGYTMNVGGPVFGAPVLTAS